MTMKKSIVICILGIAPAVVIALLPVESNRMFVQLLELLPASVLEKLYDGGSTSAYRALEMQQFHASLPDRVVFFTKMAEQGVPMAACKAGEALGAMEKVQEEKVLLEKFALRGDSCAAIERFFLGQDGAGNMQWLEIGVRNNVEECLSIVDGKYYGRPISQTIAEFCSRQLARRVDR